MYGIINGKINFRANKYEVMRGLWKGLAVPSVMYGLEIMEVGGKEKRGLEIVQNRAARRGLGANRHVATEALRGPAVLRGYFFIYRVLSMSLLSVIKCTMWNYMTPSSSPHPQKNTPHPPFYGKKKVFFKNYLLLC